MSRLEVEPLNSPFGARVTGVDLTAELSEEDIEAIREAIDTWSFLCFPEQPMTDEAHFAFTRRLGEPEAEHVTLGKTGEVVYFGTVGNVAEDGTKQNSTHPRTHYQKGNQMWHSDSSFRRVPSFVSITHAYEVPGEGGGTQFASMRKRLRRAAGGHAGRNRAAPRHPRLRLLPHQGRAGGPQPRRLPAPH